jgi:hypothetical protein
MKICPICKIQFISNAERRKYCSDDCSVLGSRINRQCKEFNITFESFVKYKTDQQDKCAICKSLLEFKKFQIHIDHDHGTGKIRGLLCRNCNLLLGHAKDDLSILLKSIEYLNSFVE